jgi:hypothetical protein
MSDEWERIWEEAVMVYLRIAIVRVGIRTEHLPKTSRERYR